MSDPPEPAVVERYLAAVELGTYWLYIRAVVAELADSRPSRARGSRTRLPWALADSRPSLIRGGRIWPLSAPISPTRPIGPFGPIIGPYRPHQPLSARQPQFQLLGNWPPATMFTACCRLGRAADLAE